jgi:rod shape determining protein RodA
LPSARAASGAKAGSTARKPISTTFPKRTTDFIFAVYGEEFGLIGNVLLLAIYLLILGRGLYIASKAPTLYSRTLAGALTMTFFCYAFVNMGMVSGILPVVGVPLPLVSYGGTATLSIMVILALLMGIANQRRQ